MFNTASDMKLTNQQNPPFTHTHNTNACMKTCAYTYNPYQITTEVPRKIFTSNPFIFRNHLIFRQKLKHKEMYYCKTKQKNSMWIHQHCQESCNSYMMMYMYVPLMYQFDLFRSSSARLSVTHQVFSYATSHYLTKNKVLSDVLLDNE